MTDVSTVLGDRDAAAAPILKIGHVANILGVPPSRIRLWEQAGLILPPRTASGQRQYSMQDVKRLEKIQKLIKGGSMTLSGIRGALDNAGDEPETALDSNPIGQRVKALRTRRKMSLRDLSEQINASPSALSAFERGLSKPSIGRISQIAHALGSTVNDLLGIPSAKGQMVVRADQRDRLPLESEGVIIENLYSSSTILQSQMVTVAPGSGSGEPMTHAGEDFLTIIEGILDVALEGLQTVRLEAGDSMTFASPIPHSYHNRGEVVARAVWINTPPTF
jgi:DNA-binding transcriptional MerR regulator/quercetin dioxygenase-like cupin family protein